MHIPAMSATDVVSETFTYDGVKVFIYANCEAFTRMSKGPFILA